MGNLGTRLLELSHCRSSWNGTSPTPPATPQLAHSLRFGVQADMAVSNALGSNIFNISLALGFPWLIGTLASQTDIRIESTALVWTTVILVAALLLYGLLLLIGRFHLQKTSGFLLVFCYLLYTAFQVWAEYQGLNSGATPMTPTPAPMYYGGAA